MITLAPTGAITPPVHANEPTCHVVAYPDPRLVRRPRHLVFLIAAGAAGASAASFGLSAVMAPTGPRRNRAVGAKTSAFSALEERWTMGSVIFFIHDLSLTGVADNTLGLARHLAKAS